MVITVSTSLSRFSFLIILSAKTDWNEILTQQPMEHRLVNVIFKQGDQIGRFFINQATFCRLVDEIGKKMSVPWATNLFHFHLNKLFKNVFCISALFGLVFWFWLLFKKIGCFFPNHLVTLISRLLFGRQFHEL